MFTRFDLENERCTAYDARISRLLLDDAENVVFTNDQALLPINLHFAALIFAEEHSIADPHVQLSHRSILLNFAIADGHDLSLDRFLFGSIRDDYPACSLLFFFFALN